VADPTEQRAGRAAGIAGAVLLLVALLAAVAAFRHVADERERALQSWQVRLGLVADSRAAAVAESVEALAAVPKEIAGNQSVQLYMTEIATAGAARPADDTAEVEYMRNLLNATAERAGFLAPAPAVAPVANTGRGGLTGLAVIDAQGRTVAATPGMPVDDEAMSRARGEALAGRPALIDAQRVGGDLRMGFAAPVAAIQADAGAKPIGAVIGLRLAGERLAHSLKQPGDVDAAARTYLVRPHDEGIDYLPALDRTLARDTPGLVDAQLIGRDNSFATGRDRDGREVLAAARAVPGTPWTLVRSVERDAALAETERRLAWTLAVILGAIAAAGAAIVAVWRHGTSMRLARAIAGERRAAAEAERLSGFLRVVADAQPTEIVALDPEGRYRFANQAAAQSAGAAPEALAGKSLEAVLGPARARPLAALNRAAAEERRAMRGEHDATPDGGQRRVVKSDHIPLAAAAGERPGVLMVLEDITALVTERERRARTLHQLVAMLVSLVDRRDPYSTDHSARAADVAGAVAREMGLDQVTVETAETAATLMNVGKVLVPMQLLTKTAPLTADELERIRAAMLGGAELVRGIEFEGPVADTLAQLQERWDGAGTPQRLTGEQILITARIVAVANAFVAMASPRAHRAGLDLDGAARALMERAGSQFDRRAVTALLNILENRDGRERWRWSAPSRT
jgi:PAS domain S-box-containing protein